MNEQQLLELGFKKEPFEKDENNYFLSRTLIQYQRGVDALELMWEREWDYVELFPYEHKIRGYSNVKKLVEVFKDI